MVEVQILYKSGNSAKFRCEEIKIRKSGDALTRIEVVGGKPRGLLFGVDYIEAIYTKDC